MPDLILFWNYFSAAAMDLLFREDIMMCVVHHSSVEGRMLCAGLRFTMCDPREIHVRKENRCFEPVGGHDEIGDTHAIWIIFHQFYVLGLPRKHSHEERFCGRRLPQMQKIKRRLTIIVDEFLWTYIILSIQTTRYNTVGHKQ